MLLLKIIFPLQLNNKYNGDFRQIIKIKKTVNTYNDYKFGILY